MKKFRFIRCKGKNDILVVSPKVYRNLDRLPRSQCGHSHYVIEGPAKFARHPRKQTRGKA